jgi:hypothetical protein
MYSKKYIKEKWDSAKHDFDVLMHNGGETDYVKYPVNLGSILYGLKDNFYAIINELEQGAIK